MQSLPGIASKLMAKSQSLPNSVIEPFLKGFSDKLAGAPKSLPSTRCITRPELISLLGEIRNALDLPIISSATATSLLGILERSGLVRKIEITSLNKKVREDRFYAVGPDVDPDNIDPSELLQSHLPDGVICYFSALQIHGLTTQPAQHHHIARLHSASEGDSAHAVPAVQQSIVPPPLGSAQFSYQGVTYFVTNRDSSNLKKHQQRYVNSRSKLRVTTLEQTLIDALHRPMSAGGPSVVFEAWDTGVAKADIAGLIDVTLQIGMPVLTRRVGYMLDRTLEKQLPAVSKLFDALAEGRPLSPSDAPASLIPFMPYKTLDRRWQLLVP